MFRIIEIARDDFFWVCADDGMRRVGILREISRGIEKDWVSEVGEFLKDIDGEVMPRQWVEDEGFGFQLAKRIAVLEGRSNFLFVGGSYGANTRSDEQEGAIFSLGSLADGRVAGWDAVLLTSLRCDRTQ